MSLTLVVRSPEGKTLDVIAMDELLDEPGIRTVTLTVAGTPQVSIELVRTDTTKRLHP